MSLSDAEITREGGERASRGRRTAVFIVGAVLVMVVGGILAAAFLQGSWWYSEGTDQPLDQENRARIEAVRATVAAQGTFPDAVTSLDTALDPTLDPSTARLYLMAAQEVLQEANDAALSESVQELQAAIDSIRPPSALERITPPPLPAIDQ